MARAGSSVGGAVGSRGGSVSISPHQGVNDIVNFVFSFSFQMVY